MNFRAFLMDEGTQTKLFYGSGPEFLLRSRPCWVSVASMCQCKSANYNIIQDQHTVHKRRRTRGDREHQSRASFTWWLQSTGCDSLCGGEGDIQSVLVAGGELARLARVRFQRAGQRQDNGERKALSCFWWSSDPTSIYESGKTTAIPFKFSLKHRTV